MRGLAELAAVGALGTLAYAIYTAMKGAAATRRSRQLADMPWTVVDDEDDEGGQCRVVKIVKPGGAGPHDRPADPAVAPSVGVRRGVHRAQARSASEGRRAEPPDSRVELHQGREVRSCIARDGTYGQPDPSNHRSYRP